MTELDFAKDFNDSLDYVIDKIYLSEAGDPEAINYIEFLWGYDEALLDRAYREYEREIQYQEDMGLL